MVKILLSISYFLFSRRSGQSLVEVLIAVGLGALFVIAAGTIIAPAINVNKQAQQIQVGTGLAKELLDNVRVWGEGDWQRILALATSSANKYYLNTASSPFTSSSGQESVAVSTTTYTRFFYVDDVKRDAGDLIVTTGGSYDPSTKKITVAYKWPPQNATRTMAAYLTRHRSKVFWQTDWSGGSGQEGPATSTNSRFSTSSNLDYTTSSGSLYLILD